MKTKLAEKKLWIAATPIGNLDEVNFRFLNQLESVEYILCEDTRITKKLLNLLKIKNKPKLVSYHKFSETEKLDYALDLINNYKVLLVSDAGYPCLSDPGYELVKLCHENQIAIEVINGSSSILHALIVSGFQTNNFMFLGFLTATQANAKKKLIDYKKIKATFVILESVHRIKQTLAILHEIFGNQPVCLARELTKQNEEIIHTTLQKIEEQEIVLKGEFVIVLDNNKIAREVIDFNLVKEKIKLMLNKKMHTKEISQMIAEEFKLNSKEIYQRILELKNEK